ncbi:hypothetical protein F5Y11DRAFT_222331 [Daldinia sp. FL1419]|nr:hypothetical protein F5Y11DRAFT_222331 [Daldinia sp. FL1419]
MCSGERTYLDCGHHLTTYVKRCTQGHLKPCPEPTLVAPPTKLADCCAECDPIYNQNLVHREHRDRHAELLNQVYKYQHAGHVEKVEKLLDRIEVLQRKANRAMGEARYLCSSAVDVQFPGGGPDAITPRGTSRWIDGKCVWEEEQPYSVPKNKYARKIVPEQTQEEQRLVLGPPRLSTEKGSLDRKYFEAQAELQREREWEQLQASKVMAARMPRLQTNKKYTGPRWDVVATSDEGEDQQQAPSSSMQPRLRRSKKYINKLSQVGSVGKESYNSRDSRDSDETVRPARNDSRTQPVMPAAEDDEEKEEEEEEKDIWLEEADRCV